MLTIGKRGLDLIKSYEKLELTAYHGEADRKEVWTIGYGHTKGVKPGMTIDNATALLLLDQDLDDAEEDVRNGVNLVITTQDQYDAMVSLTFNIGGGAFVRSSVLRFHNQGEYFKAAAAFDMWVYSAGQKRRGLLRRRLEEARLYCDTRFIRYDPEEGS